MNYDFLIYDYRGFGKSTGPLNETGFHQDAKALYDYLKTKFAEQDIIVVGRSIGTGFAAKLASENNPGLLILITPYYSLKELAKKYFPLLPVGLILKYNLKTYAWVKKVKSRVVIFHGTEDEVIPFEQAVRLKNSLKHQDLLISIKGAGHNDLSGFPEYQKHMEELLREKAYAGTGSKAY